jgi:hypothetical protein
MVREGWKEKGRSEGRLEEEGRMGRGEGGL